MNSFKKEALALNAKGLFSAEPTRQGIAQDLYEAIKNLPFISRHGLRIHTGLQVVRESATVPP